MPPISVVIKTHNRLRLLPRAIESARVTGMCVEIVVDDFKQLQFDESK